MEEYQERDDPTALSVKEQEDNPLNAWQLMVAEFDAKLGVVACNIVNNASVLPMTPVCIMPITFNNGVVINCQ